MLDRERFRLLDSYKTPRVRIGTVMSCEYRDCDVIVVSYSDAKIPWPVGRRKGTSARTLVLFGGLAEAVKRESNQAVCHWFGVTPQTVCHWRKALGVGLTNDGTHRLRSDYQKEPAAKMALAKAQAKSSDPGRRRKLSAAFKGRKPPQHVIEAAHKARTGMKHTATARAKMSAARRKWGKNWAPGGPVYTVAEDEILRTRPAPIAAKLTGRTLTSVYSRRLKLGLADGRANNGGKRA